MIEIIQNSPVATFIFLTTIITSLYVMYRDQGLYSKLMLHPYSFTRGKHYYTIITSGLIHADFNHLLFNMLSYLFFAFRLEQIVGHLQFLGIYFFGLVLSDVYTILKNKNNIRYYSLGASGAISAVLFSYILFDPLTRLYVLFIPIEIPAFLFAILYLAYCVYASKKQYDHVNHEAHFFGALTGVLTTVIFYPSVVNHFIKQILLFRF